VAGLPSSGVTRPSTAIASNYERDPYTKISTSYRDSSIAPAGPKPSIKGTTDGDLHLESSDYTSDNLRLRFRLFGLSIPA
jgi:hypothetical protein